MKTIRGWVYVITNKAMPDLVKIGYSTKDPALRAVELGSTGIPHPFEVQYDLLVIQPREVEQRVHGALADLNEAKEWFRCTVSHAIGTIVSIAGSDALLENPEETSLSRTAAAKIETGLASGKSNSCFDNKDVQIEINVSKSNVDRFTRTIAVNGACQKCGTRFSVTLIRGESSARCPECFSSVTLGGNWS